MRNLGLTPALVCGACNSDPNDCVKVARFKSRQRLAVLDPTCDWERVATSAASDAWAQVGAAMFPHIILRDLQHVAVSSWKDAWMKSC